MVAERNAMIRSGGLFSQAHPAPGDKWGPGAEPILK